MKAKEAIEDAYLTKSYDEVSNHRVHEAFLEYIKEVEDRLQGTLEVNHLWDGS
jgi:phosphoribosylcarboxyaminoimidazole (NCAIR) mutase